MEKRPFRYEGALSTQQVTKPKLWIVLILLQLFPDVASLNYNTDARDFAVESLEFLIERIRLFLDRVESCIQHFNNDPRHLAERCCCYSPIPHAGVVIDIDPLAVTDIKDIEPAELDAATILIAADSDLGRIIQRPIDFILP